MTFSPDGTKLATGSSDWSARIWDVATGKPLGDALQHRGPVYEVAFSPDGTKLATASWDGAARLWDVPGSLVESADHTLLWAESLVGATVNDAGELRQLIPDEIRRKQGALRAAGGPPRSWRAALDRRWQLYSADDWQRLRDRGNRHARAGQWQKAAADFTAALQAHPGDHWLWFQSAGLWLMLGDTDAYHRHCRAMMDRFGKTEDPMVAARTTQACLLTPDSVADLAPVVRLADLAVTGTEKDLYYNYFLLARGLAHYRAGEFAPTIERLDKCVTPDNPPTGCDAEYLVLAMAHHRLGRADEADKTLAKARETIDKQSWPKIDSGDLGDSWHDVVMFHILRREADVLIGKTADKPEE